MVSIVSLRTDKTTLTDSEINPAAGTIYLAESPDRGWCRVVAINAPTADGKVFVRLIDFGDVEIFAVSDLRSLASLSPLLARMAGQATRTRLARVPPSPDFPFTEKTAQRLRELAPKNVDLVMRVVEMTDKTVPIVELFQRVNESGVLGALNTTLEMEMVLSKTDSQVPVDSMAVLALGSAGRNSTGSVSKLPAVKNVSPSLLAMEVISPAKVPAENGEFCVHVCNVSSPSNFFVQPLSSFPQLKAMLTSLQVMTIEDISTFFKSSFQHFILLK